MRNQPPQRRKDDLKARHNPRVHSILGKETPIGRRSGGFSLIEVLVVISIIGLILGIGVGVALKMTAEARRNQTREMMKSLLSANDEYKAVRQGQNIAESGPLSGVTVSLSSTERFIEECARIKSCDEIVHAALLSGTQEANNRLFRDESDPSKQNNYKSVYDRWGTELEYRTFNDQTGIGPTNSFGKSQRNEFLPRSRDPFFVSAGPDKKFGTEDDITTLQK